MHKFKTRSTSWFTLIRLAIGKAITGGIVVAAISLLFAWFVMLLWNWVMVDVLGLAIITFWQAWGLMVISGLLLKK